MTYVPKTSLRIYLSSTVGVFLSEAGEAAEADPRSFFWLPVPAADPGAAFAGLFLPKSGIFE